MSDMVNGSGYFHQAYRVYASEQGNDPQTGRIKAAEVASATEPFAVAPSIPTAIVDEVFISPEAARLYLGSLRRRALVERKSETKAFDGMSSSTAAEPFDETTTLASERPIEKLGHDIDKKS
ncbi:hypothetical protein GCM10025857_06090 [Alicyclobacillus contaminans]|uniref:hypothetical protein n=1 Tax=Alicyclobacillus contaminans TaxID=392016 RepID=UPI00041D3C7D|nr:hypothetical protein [Alicyclobacillus contaminans]GMA49252.1 hypothetical protein GCM10025857_06090 [Alicyclobacillus contaminans]